jgi:hypothetical protein
MYSPFWKAFRFANDCDFGRDSIADAKQEKEKLRPELLPAVPLLLISVLLSANHYRLLHSRKQVKLRLKYFRWA